MKREILIHSTAEFLAKQDDFARDSLDPYLEIAERYHNGDKSGIDSDYFDSLLIHSLMLEDDELTVLEQFPDLKEAFEESDNTQIRSVKSVRNLNFFSKNGVEYEFDKEQIQQIIGMLVSNIPLSVSLMREKVIAVSGLGRTRLNYIYHDVIDHVWLFDFIKAQGLYSRYQDFMESIGDPFTGHLLSKQSELLSGIGFTSRRYLLQPDYYDQMSLETSDLTAHVRTENKFDERTEIATDILQSRPEISGWIGFVVKDTIANLLMQRGRRGGVKKLTSNKDGDMVSTDELMPLLDPIYLALIIETVAALSKHKEDFLKAQIKLNLLVERALAQYLRGIEMAGRIILTENIIIDDIRKSDAVILQRNPGLSTNYFGKVK